MSFKEILEYIHAHMADVTEEEVLRALEEDEESRPREDGLRDSAATGKRGGQAAVS